MICCCCSKGFCRFFRRWSGFCRWRRYFSFFVGCCFWLLLLLWISYRFFCCYGRFGFFGKKRREVRLSRFCCCWMVREFSFTVMLIFIVFVNKMSFFRIVRCFFGIRCWVYIVNGYFVVYVTVFDVFTCIFDVIYFDNFLALICSVRYFL